MLKRQQETSVMLSSSSSRRRQNLPNHQNQDRSIKPPAVGCLSGILHLVSKYHNRRRRKFLTFGKKQGRNGDVEVPLNSSVLSEEAVNNKKKKEDGGRDKIRHAERLLSCQVPRRSPTLPPEIRQWASVISPENFRDGRSTTTATSSPPAAPVWVDERENNYSTTSSSEEERSKLLGALKKCDEDLKAIKNIIEALRPPPLLPSERDQPGMKAAATIEKKFDFSRNDEENLNMMDQMQENWRTGFKHSPISVLHNFIDHPVNLNSPSCFSKIHITNGQLVQQQKPQPRKKYPTGQGDTITSTRFFHRSVTTIGVSSVPIKREIVAWSNKAMEESVVEVCNDVDCGERREVMRVGLVLQDYIFRDLVDQVFKELLLFGRAATHASDCCLYSPLPLEACKKRLRF